MGHHHEQCNCGCGGHGMSGTRAGRSAGHGQGWRRYVSPGEEREFIDRYISDLEKEIAGAKARLAEIAGT